MPLRSSSAGIRLDALPWKADADAEGASRAVAGRIDGQRG